MKTIYQTENEIDAKMLVELLNNNGIPARVNYEHADSYLNITGAGIRLNHQVVVPENDYEQAIRIAKENRFLTVSSNKTKVKTNHAQVYFARAMLIFTTIVIIGVLVYSLIYTG